MSEHPLLFLHRPASDDLEHIFEQACDGDLHARRPYNWPGRRDVVIRPDGTPLLVNPRPLRTGPGSPDPS